MRRRMMMMKAKPSVFVPARLEVTPPTNYQVNRNFIIRAVTSIPVENNPSETIDRLVLLDSEGNEHGDFKWTNSKAVANGLADYCQYSITCKETVALESYTYQVIAINGDGVRSEPVIITIPLKT